MSNKSRFTPSYLAVMQGLSIDPVPQRQQPTGRHRQHPRPHEAQHVRPREVQQVRKIKSKLTWRWGSNNKAPWEN